MLLSDTRYVSDPIYGTQAPSLLALELQLLLMGASAVSPHGRCCYYSERLGPNLLSSSQLSSSLVPLWPCEESQSHT